MHARLCWATGVHIRDTQMEAREKKRDQENLPSTAKPTPKGPKAQSKAKSSLNQLQRNRSQVSWLPAPSVAGPPPLTGSSLVNEEGTLTSTSGRLKGPHCA